MELRLFMKMYEDVVLFLVRWRAMSTIVSSASWIFCCLGRSIAGRVVDS